MLNVEGLRVSINGKEIVRGVDLEVDGIVAMLGPNGSGKSTLGYAIAGNPVLEVDGRISLDGEDITDMEADERAKKGILMAFQHPPEIEGLSYRRFLRVAWERLGKEGNFREELERARKEVGIPEKFLSRDVNVGFSGGEKKKMELLQMVLFKPRLGIFDEIDSGLDVDSLKTAAKIINSLDNALVITHYTRLIKLINPERVVVMKDGRIVAEGGMEIAERIDSHGYSL